MLASIQSLRGLAALMVVYHHASFQLYRDGPGSLPLASLGAAGVDLFFVISGFIICATTAREHPSARAFVARRLTRVVPLYWLVSAALLALAAVAPAAFNSTSLDLAHGVATFLFVAWPHPVIHEMLPLYVPGWTVNYEMFFYALTALSIVAAPRRWFGILLSAITILAVLGQVLPAGTLGPRGSFYLAPIILEFALGLLCGRLFLSGRVIAAPLVGAAAGAGLLVASAVYGIGFGPEGRQIGRLLYWGVPSALVVVGLAIRERDRPFAYPAWAVRLGDASFSIYMTHVVLLVVIARAWRQFGFGVDGIAAALYTAVALVGACLGGTLCYLALERPLLRIIRQRRGGPLDGASVVAAR